MGPFPHSAPRAVISAENPAGTDGFEFVEFAHPNPDELRATFAQMGYTLTARHKTKAIEQLQILLGTPGKFPQEAEAVAMLKKLRQ